MASSAISVEIRKLYEAALRGEVHQFCETFGENPLHIAARLGHLDYVILLASIPELARRNSKGRCPLHLASAKGHLEVVKELLKVDSGACFVRDCDGMIPLHTAVIKGQVEVIEILFGAQPLAVWILTDLGEPILHLCARYEQFRALMVIAFLMKETDFLEMTDDNNDNIFHLLAAKQQYQVIEILVTQCLMDEIVVNHANAQGLTALDVVRWRGSGHDGIRTKRVLRAVGALGAAAILRYGSRGKSPDNSDCGTTAEEMTKTREALMVVATLMATLTFQSASNPPGGVWQQDGYSNITQTGFFASSKPNHATSVDQLQRNNNSSMGATSMKSYFAGQSVMSFKFPLQYIVFMSFNSVSFFASLCIILILSGFALKRRLPVPLLTTCTRVAASSLLMTYGCSVYVTASDQVFKNFFWVKLPVYITGWSVLIFLLFSSHLLPSIPKLPYLVVRTTLTCIWFVTEEINDFIVCIM